MGVHGLWELLAPVGRRVSVENLSGKRLAIDASIWMVQFMKAMRDENGEMVRNAHLLGFFRRICKLLFLRTKPVFVFDGATPALKRRTVLARRRQNENAQAKIRKTAEKLLLNHLKEINLKRLAEDLKNQKQDVGGKGKSVVVDGMENDERNVKSSSYMSASYDQEKLDEMLAASLAAEANGTFTGDTSAARVFLEGENNSDEELEELVLPAIQGDVDPNVLSSLPPSMQLDLLSQMRERLMAENRQKYQKVKKAPEKFSALQIQSYLKTVAFRREIDEVQKSAGSRGVGGVQTKKIASETSREFIFSSSFAGDREVLASSRMENIISNKEKVSSAPHPSPALVSHKRTQSNRGPDVNQSKDSYHENVETYLDERGRVHVSRGRALGIRMTRDLQRNLDMMKEMEHEKYNVEDATRNFAAASSSQMEAGGCLLSTNQMEARFDIEPVSDHSFDIVGASTPADKNSLVISFDGGFEDNCYDEDDEIFRSLVAGKPHGITEADNVSFTKQSNVSDSCIEWDDGFIEGNLDGNNVNEVQMMHVPLSNEGVINDDTGVEWEDGVSDSAPEAAFPLEEHFKAASKGVLEEESQLQEAIKRSLQDAQALRMDNASVETGCAFSAIDVALISSNENELPNCSLLKQKEQDEISFSCESLDVGWQDIAGERSVVPITTEKLSAILEEKVHKYNNNRPTPDNDPMEIFSDVGGNADHYIPGFKTSIVSENKDACSGVSVVDSTSVKSASNIDKSMNDSSARAGILPVQESKEALLGANLIDSTLGCVNSAPEYSESMNDSSAPPRILSVQEKGNSVASDFNISFLEGSEPDISKREDLSRSGVFKLNASQREDLEASLVDELSVLNNERLSLGNEQKKLERNAEAVSGEMFAECQELLQMFGLPYIIAPMEAEAQCAFLEQAGLVDGVVTDDSDVFLFGAQNVYKNIFDNRKYVETYFMKDIETELGVSREKLIRMAMLLGSDYTEGVSGIGIVNAVEVLNAFPEEDGLRKFREWIESPDPTIFYKKKDVKVNKKGSTPVKKGHVLTKKGIEKHGEGLSCSADVLDQDESGDIDQGTVDDIHELKQTFMDKHRNVSKNWHVPSSFPSDAVISAYTSPKVDLSTEPFSHGRPDHPVLRKFCLERFGWSYPKTDELLLPVLKEYSKRETQLRLEAFYTFNEKFAKIRSKRIKKAVKGITGKHSLHDNVRTVSECNNGHDSGDPEEPAGTEFSIQGCSTSNEVNLPVGKSQKKINRKRKPCKEHASTEKPKDGSQVNANDRHNVSKKSSGFKSGLAGVSSTKQLSRKRGKLSDSSDIFAGEASREKKTIDIHERPQKLRRSTRTREAVKYTSDEEVDVFDMSSENTEEPHAEEVQGTPNSSVSPLDPLCMNQSCAPSATSTSGDYLQMGGGFCVDDKEKVADES